MKKLSTERLILREWRQADLPQFYNNCKNAKVGPLAGWKPHGAIEDSEKILNMFIEADETWAIVLKDGGKLIGSVGLHSDKSRVDIDKVKSLGYVLAEEYWGRGYMPEACKEVIRFGFEELELKLISVAHFPFNSQSKRVIQKCGFVYEGTSRYAFKRPYDDTVLDQCIYSMTKDEYAVNRKVNHSGSLQKDMSFSIVRMSKVNAYNFLEWRYDPPLEIYNCPSSDYERRVSQIIGGSSGKSYFSVYDSFGDFFGVYVYCFTEDEKLQIEFRVKPEMMGKGYGISFMRECIRFGKKEYSYAGSFVLRIASVNTRVQQMLSCIGFQEKSREIAPCNGQESEYIFMELDQEK